MEYPLRLDEPSEPQTWRFSPGNLIAGVISTNQTSDAKSSVSGTFDYHHVLRTVT